MSKIKFCALGGLGENGKNCFYNATTCKNPDRFVLKLNQRGRLCVDGDKEIQYMNSSDVTKQAEEYTEDVTNTFACTAEEALQASSSSSSDSTGDDGTGDGGTGNGGDDGNNPL